MNPPDIQIIDPLEIEAESFRIIEAELGQTAFSPEQFAVVRRCIHATGDFSFAETMRFHPQAVEAGLRAVRSGRNILVDVNMAASGISKQLLARFGGRVICRAGDAEAAAQAAARNITRSEAAAELAAGENIGIAVIGNAPTALLKVMELMERGQFAPDLVIGVPVGFVNAAESKAILASKPWPFITALGRKGGTPVAVAAVNALLRLA
ncbi:MAG: precorrin-8X methylmutase [Candidatus Electronema sp. V4]|uniref:precorrin-8X methylmutase n=1 Tax=Candidatus Electronema sp. V4 TaxID=3454756 RepID=UPI0040557914